MFGNCVYKVVPPWLLYGTQILHVLSIHVNRLKEFDMFNTYITNQVSTYRAIGHLYGSYAQVGYIALRVAIPLTIGKLVAPYASIILGGFIGF